MATEVKWTQRGQRHAYGDSFYVAEIHTDEKLTEEEILKLVNNRSRLPYAEWRKHFGNPSIYFGGYYTITPTSYGYKYEGCNPYTD